MTTIESEFDLDTEFIRELNDEVTRERERLRACVDRLDALHSLKALADRMARRLGRPVTADDLINSPSDEVERAELEALSRRVIGDTDA